MSNSGPAGLDTLNTAAATLDRIAQEYVDAGRAVGLSAAIVQDGRIAVLRQYGLACRETGEPVTEASRFPIGSVSKQFTAAAVLALVEDGKLSLDDPVARFYPDLTRAGDVSVRQLLNHTSGYPDWYPLDTIDDRLTQSTTIEEMRWDYGRRALDFEPGAYYSYSNTGYMIAACIVEVLSGYRFFDFLQKRILEPLGMTGTCAYRRSGPDFVSRYRRYFEGPLESAPLEGMGWLTGAGGMVSTAEDLAKWNIALMSGALLSEESWREMSSATKMPGGRLSFYGLGLTLGRRHGCSLLVHRGGVSGAVSENTLCRAPYDGVWPRDGGGVAISWLSNLETVALWPIVGTLLDDLISESGRTDAPAPVYNAMRVIEVDGPPPEESGAVLFRSIVDDTIDRSRLSAECNEYLDEDRLAINRPRLRALGEPSSVTVGFLGERSGMQVAELFFAFESGRQRALIARFPDGKIAEFMFQT